MVNGNVAVGIDIFDAFDCRMRNERVCRTKMTHRGFNFVGAWGARFA